MESIKKNYPKRTREEILAWLQEARNRKAAFQREVELEWKARQMGKLKAAESGYYDLEWV